MNVIHTMRLKGPWEFEWLRSDSGDESDPATGRIKLPAHWAECFGDRRGAVRLTRRFQRPTNLDATERVMIAVTEVFGLRGVRVNECDLPLVDQPEHGFRFDVTDLLERTNLLSVELECSPAEDAERRGLYSPVVIEIWSLTA